MNELPELIDASAFRKSFYIVMTYSLYSYSHQLHYQYTDALVYIQVGIMYQNEITLHHKL